MPLGTRSRFSNCLPVGLEAAYLLTTGSQYAHVLLRRTSGRLGRRSPTWVSGTPRLNKHGSIDHRLQQQLRGWTKSDGPPKRLKPIKSGLIHHTFAALHRQDKNKSKCLKWIIYVAVFSLNRPGECSMMSGDPHPFRWCDIQLYMGQLHSYVFEAKASQLRAADWSGMTFTMQKSRVPGKNVGHVCSGALHACPVVGLAEL